MLTNRLLYRELITIRDSINRLVRAQNFDNRSLEIFNLEFLDSNFKPIKLDNFESEYHFTKKFLDDSKHKIYLRDKHSLIFLGVFQVTLQDNLLILFQKYPHTQKLNHQDLIYEHLFRYITDRTDNGEVSYGFGHEEGLVKFPSQGYLKVRTISNGTFQYGLILSKTIFSNLGYYTKYYDEGERLAMCFVFNFIGGILFLPLIATWVGNNLSLMMITLFSPTFVLYLGGLVYHTYQDLPD
jgi:hypothetical protein